MIKRRQDLGRVYIPCLLIFLFPLLIFGCAREVSWIRAEPKSVELKKIGETFQLKVAALDKENKPVPEARLAWKSSRPSVAMVDRNGLITAKGSGNSVISVLSENGEKAVVQCKVAVTAGIVIKPKQLELRVGEKFELDTDVVDEKGAPAENQTVNWASSNHSVAIVNDYGEVTALSPGEITITATQIEVYAKVKVIVKPAEQSE